jgi:hypothetical protein
VACMKALIIAGAFYYPEKILLMYLIFIQLLEQTVMKNSPNILNILARWLVCWADVFYGYRLSLTVKSNLGTSPISSLPPFSA